MNVARSMWKFASVCLSVASAFCEDGGPRLVASTPVVQIGQPVQLCLGGPGGPYTGKVVIGETASIPIETCVTDSPKTDTTYLLFSRDRTHFFVSSTRVTVSGIRGEEDCIKDSTRFRQYYFGSIRPPLELAVPQVLRTLQSLGFGVRNQGPDDSGLAVTTTCRNAEISADQRSAIAERRVAFRLHFARIKNGVPIAPGDSPFSIGAAMQYRLRAERTWREETIEQNVQLQCNDLVAKLRSLGPIR